MKKIFTLLVVLAAALGMQAQEPDKWAIAGDEALMGEAWNEKSDINVMTTTDNIHYTLVKENVMLKAKSYYYKACQNNGWAVSVPEGSGNNELSIAENGAYRITFSLDLTPENVSLTAEATKTGEYEGSTEATIVVAGASAILGENWAAASAENTMATTDGVNYTLTKTDCALRAFDKYEYKYVIDGTYYGDAGEGKFGAKDAKGEDYGNFILSVTENGKYTVTFTLNLTEKTCVVSTEKTGEAEFAERVWAVAGSNADIFGTTWDPANADNNMTKLEDGSYQLIKYSITFAEQTVFQYKVAADGTWDVQYPGGTDNQKFEIETAGTYNIEFNWMPESEFLYAELKDPTPAPGPDGISTVKAVKADAAIYNLAGQRVNGTFRGIAIQNGRKCIMK